MTNQMTLTFNNGITISDEFDSLYNFFSEKFPSEVKSLFQKCVDSIKDNSKVQSNEKYTLTENGSYMNLKIGKTSKNESIKLLKVQNYIVIKRSCNVLFVPEINISLCFDEREVLKEITLEKNNTGKTQKGLMVGDSIQKAINIYGQPKMLSIVSAIWENIIITIENDYITSIRIQK